MAGEALPASGPPDGSRAYLFPLKNRFRARPAAALASRGVVQFQPAAVAEGDGPVQRLPIRHLELQKQPPQLAPEVQRALRLGFRRLEQGAATLLDLIDEKGQHHQVGEHRRQMLLATRRVPRHHGLTGDSGNSCRRKHRCRGRQLSQRSLPSVRANGIKCGAGRVQEIATTHSPELLSMVSDKTFGNTSVTCRLEHTNDAIIRAVADLPNAEKLRKNQGLGRLLAGGWMETALAFTEGREDDRVASE